MGGVTQRETTPKLSPPCTVPAHPILPFPRGMHLQLHPTPEEAENRNSIEEPAQGGTEGSRIPLAALTWPGDAPSALPSQVPAGEQLPKLTQGSCCYSWLATDSQPRANHIPFPFYFSHLGGKRICRAELGGHGLGTNIASSPPRGCKERDEAPLEAAREGGM